MRHRIDVGRMEDRMNIIANVFAAARTAHLEAHIASLMHGEAADSGHIGRLPVGAANRRGGERSFAEDPLTAHQASYLRSAIDVAVDGRVDNAAIAAERGTTPSDVSAVMHRLWKRGALVRLGPGSWRISKRGRRLAEAEL